MTGDDLWPAEMVDGSGEHSARNMRHGVLGVKTLRVRSSMMVISRLSSRIKCVRRAVNAVGYPGRAARFSVVAVCVA